MTNLLLEENLLGRVLREGQIVRKVFFYIEHWIHELTIHHYMHTHFGWITPQILDVGKSNEHWWITMPFCGHTLSNSELTFANYLNLKRFLKNALLAMTYLFIRHMDIKADNIVFDGRRFMLIDWGSSVWTTRDIRAQRRAGVGTIEYWPRGCYLDNYETFVDTIDEHCVEQILSRYSHNDKEPTDAWMVWKASMITWPQNQLRLLVPSSSSKHPISTSHTI